MFKLKNDFLPVNFKCYFLIIDKIYNHLARSSQRKFFLPRCNSKHGLKYLAYQGSKLWT